MSAYEYLTVNSLTAYPFRDGRATHATFPLEADIFLDILFVIYRPSIKRPYIKVIRPEVGRIEIDFHDVYGDLKIFTVAIPTNQLVSHYKNFDKCFFGYRPSEYYPKASVKLVFGAGVNRLLELTESVTFSPEETEISPSAVQYSVPEVSTVLFESWLPSFDDPGYDPREGQSVYPIKTYMREEDVYMRYGHNNVFNYLNPRTMYLDVIRGAGLGLYDPCPVVPPNNVVTTINRVEPDPAGNIYFKVSDCHSLRLLTDDERQSALDRILLGGKDYANFQIDHYLKFWDTGNTLNYHETYANGKSFNVLDEDFINHGFVLENHCKPKCPHENLNAFAQYLNRVKDGVSELYKIVENASETCGWATIEGNVLTATSFCQNLPQGNSPWLEAPNCNSGFLKYFHEGRKIKIRKDSSTTYSVEIVKVVEAESGPNVQIILNQAVTGLLPSTEYLFKVADFGLLNKLNFEIAKHNDTLISTNNPYIDFNYSTVEAFNSEQKYVTFITSVTVIYNPRETPLNFAVAYGSNTTTTLIPSSIKIRSAEGVIDYNADEGTIPCKRYATAEAIFQVPCNGVDGVVEISVIDNDTGLPLENSPKEITIKSANCIDVNVDTLRRPAYENKFYGFSLAEDLEGIDPSTVDAVSFSNFPGWLTVSELPEGDLNEEDGIRYQLYGTPTANFVGEDLTQNQEYSIDITLTTNEGVFLTTLFLSYIARPRITYPANGDTIEIRPPDTLNRNYTAGSPLIRIDATNSPTSYRFNWEDGLQIPGFGWSDNKLIGKYGYNPNQTYPISYTVTLTARNAASPEVETGDLSITVTIVVSNLSTSIDPPAVQNENFCYELPNPNNGTLSLISTLPSWLNFKSNLTSNPQGCNLYGLNTSDVSILEKIIIRYDYGDKFENIEYRLPYIADPVITYPPAPGSGGNPFIVELRPPDYSSLNGSIQYTVLNPVIKVIATNNPTNFSATGLPNGLTIDSSGNIIGQIPSGPQLENNPVTITVVNAAGTSQRTFTLRLINTEEEIVVLENSNFCRRFAELSKACTAQNCWGIQWEDQLPPPTWLRINQKTTAACHFETSERPTDPLSKSRRFTLSYVTSTTTGVSINSNYVLKYIAKPRILSPTSNDIFTIASQNLEDVEYTQENPLLILDIQNTTPATTYQIIGLPAGLNLIDGKIIGSFESTANLVGDYLITLNVENTAGIATSTFKIVISNNTTQKAYQGVPYCYKITGLTGAVSYDYEVLGDDPFISPGNPGGWLNFNPSTSANCPLGNLYGTPGAGLTENKTYELVIKAIRANGNIVSQALRIQYFAKPIINYPYDNQTFTIAPPDYNNFLFTASSPVFKVDATNSPTSFYVEGFSPGTFKITRNGELIGVSGSTIDSNIPVQIYAVNEAGESIPRNINFVITNTVKTIAFDSTVNTPCTTGSIYKFETNLDLPEAITLSGQPEWITFDPVTTSTCNLTFNANKPTFTTSQTFPLVLTRKYKKGADLQGNPLYSDVRESFNLLITAPPAIITPSPDRPIRYVISQPDYNNRIYTVNNPLATVRATNNPTSITATGLPPGLQIVETGNNIGKIVSIGSSKVSQIGIYTVSAVATNLSGSSAPVNFEIEVKNEILQIFTKEGQPIQGQFCKLTTLDDATAYNIISGGLLDGLSFSGSPLSSCNFLGIPRGGNAEESRLEISSNYLGGSSNFAIDFIHINKPTIVKFRRNGIDVVNHSLNIVPSEYVDETFTEENPFFEVVTTGNPSSFYAEGLPVTLSITCDGKVVGTLASSLGGLSIKIIAVNEAGESPSRTITLNLSKLIPVITWNNPSEIFYGTVLNITDHLNATVDVPGNLLYVPPAGTRLNASDQLRPLTVYFTPQDTTTYASIEKSVGIKVNKVTPVITWNNPDPISYFTQLSSIVLNATADTDGTFTYNPTSGSRLNAGMYTLSCIFTPTDVTNFNTATKSVTLTITKITVTPANMYWSNPANIQFGSPLTGTQLNAVARISATDATSPNIPSNNSSYVYDPPLNTILPVGTHTLKVTFTSSDTVNFTNTPVEKTVTIQVTERQIPIVWPTPSTIAYGTPLSGTQLNATSTVPNIVFSYTPEVGTVLNAGFGQFLSVSATSPDGNYAPTTITRLINVDKANSEIIINSPATGKVGDTINLEASVNGSGGNVTFTSTNNSVISIVNSNQAQLLRAGSATVTATVAGDNNYNSASKGQVITIQKGDSSLTINSADTLKVGENLNVNVIKSGSTSSVSLTSNNTSVLSFSQGVSRGLSTGTATITASVTADQNYNSATATKVIQVTKGNSSVEITSANTGIETNTLALVATKTGSTGQVVFTSNNNQIVSISGQIATLLAPGQATITAYLPADNNYEEATATQSFTVTTRQNSSITYVGPIQGFVGDFIQMTVNKSGSKGSVTYSSNNPNVASITGSSTVNLLSEGTAQITITLVADKDFKEAITTFNITSIKKDSTLTLTGADTIMVGQRYVLSVNYTGSNGGLTYQSNNTAVATVDQLGVVTLTNQAVGQVTISATLAANNFFNSATASKTFTVVQADSTLNITGPNSAKVGDTLVPILFNKTGSNATPLFSATTSSGITINTLNNLASFSRAGTQIFTGSLAGNTTHKGITVQKQVSVSRANVVLTLLYNGNLTPPASLSPGEILIITPVVTPVNTLDTNNTTGFISYNISPNITLVGTTACTGAGPRGTCGIRLMIPEDSGYSGQSISFFIESDANYNSASVSVFIPIDIE